MNQAKRNFESEKFFVYLVGSSRDLRTNVWRLTCKSCKKMHEPPTTMFSLQSVECKCGIKEVLDYNLLQDSEIADNSL